MIAEGRKVGAMFKSWKWWPNTLMAHKLVKFANERFSIDTGKCNAVLFHALYEEGKNVSNLDVLLDIGKYNLNLPESDLRACLESSEEEQAIRNEIMIGQRNHSFSGVPFFILNVEGGSGDPYTLSGAQSSDTFLRIFQILTQY
mmetsp:Transcript_2280/g.3199  ORF Transcript_2280/g.3199 Transcript_2280/m.3199 type:complete len:144 (-) Transcript_2280:155-586(-)